MTKRQTGVQSKREDFLGCVGVGGARASPPGTHVFGHTHVLSDTLFWVVDFDVKPSKTSSETGTYTT